MGYRCPRKRTVIGSESSESEKERGPHVRVRWRGANTGAHVWPHGWKYAQG